MKATINGEPLYIRWKYEQVEINPRGLPAKLVEQTTCIIETSEKEVVGTASIRPWHRDIPNRDKARKESLTLAVQHLGRSARSVIWDLYNNRCKKPEAKLVAIH